MFVGEIQVLAISLSSCRADGDVEVGGFTNHVEASDVRLIEMEWAAI